MPKTKINTALQKLKNEEVRKRKLSKVDDALHPATIVKRVRLYIMYGNRYITHYNTENMQIEKLHEEPFECKPFTISDCTGKLFPMSGKCFSDRKVVEEIIRKREELLKSPYGLKYLREKEKLQELMLSVKDIKDIVDGVYIK